MINRVKKVSSLLGIVLCLVLPISGCGEDSIVSINGKNKEFIEQENQEYKLYYEDEKQAIELVKSYFEDWFKYRNVEKLEGSSEFKYPDYKIRDNSSSGFTYDSEAFRSAYAWSGEANLSNLYGANIMESDDPSDTLSVLEDFVNVKVIWARDNIMHVGVILNYVGKSKVVGSNSTSKGVYYGIVEVIKEEVNVQHENVESVQEQLRIKSVNTLAPLVRTSAKQASDYTIDQFVRLMNGEGVSLFEVAFKEANLLNKYASDGKLTKKKKLTEEDVRNCISDYYATNEYYKGIALRNYELMCKGVRIEDYCKVDDARTLVQSMSDEYSDIVKISYTPEKSKNTKDIFGSITINNDTRICLFDNDYYGMEYGDIEQTRNEELLGITYVDSLGIEAELYSVFDCDRSVSSTKPECDYKGVLKSDKVNALVIKKGYAITSLEALKSNYQELKESGFTTKDGKAVGMKGVVTYNSTLGVAVIKISDDTIEPAVFSNDFEYIWSENDYGISKSHVCEVGNSRIQVYLPLLKESSVVYNEKGEVVCMIVNKPECTIYDARGIGRSIVEIYSSLLDLVKDEIGYIDNLS